MVAKNKNKKPKYKNNPSFDKKPRIRDIADTNQQTISWQFSKIDLSGEWCCKNIDSTTLWDFIFNKIKSFETMTWAEIYIDEKNNHDVAKNKLTPKAQKRLREINQADIDSLFTLHLSGLRRIWGIRDGRALQILWYDSKHNVCKSNLKNT